MTTYTVTDAISFLHQCNSGRFKLVAADVWSKLLRDLEEQHAHRERLERRVAALEAELQIELPEASA